MRNSAAEKRAKKATERFLSNFRFKRGELPDIGIILGTGWGDVFDIEPIHSTSLVALPGFESLGNLAGHNRELIYGTVGNVPVLALRGRVHMNEAPMSTDIPKMVRLQTELMIQLGIRKLIVTAAVGSVNSTIRVGDVVVVDGFVSLFAPAMPLWAGEFCSPDDALDEEMRAIALRAGTPGTLDTHSGSYAMVRGPFFEGRRYDKPLLRQSGADVVGMSMLPSTCVSALYNIPTLGLAFVTNDDTEEHSHEMNIERAKASAEHLGAYLNTLIGRL